MFMCIFQFMALTKGVSDMARSRFITLLLDKRVARDSLLASCLFSKFAQASTNSISFPEFVAASVAVQQ